MGSVVAWIRDGFSNFISVYSPCGRARPRVSPNLALALH